MVRTVAVDTVVLSPLFCEKDLALPARVATQAKVHKILVEASSAARAAAESCCMDATSPNIANVFQKKSQKMFRGRQSEGRQELSSAKQQTRVLIGMRAARSHVVVCNYIFDKCLPRQCIEKAGKRWHTKNGYVAMKKKERSIDGIIATLGEKLGGDNPVVVRMFEQRAEPSKEELIWQRGLTRFSVKNDEWKRSEASYKKMCLGDVETVE